MMRMGQPRESAFSQAEREGDLGTAILGTVLGILWRMLRWLLRHPRTTAVLVLMVLLGKITRQVGDWVGYLSVTTLVLAIVAWRLFAADHFNRHVTARFRSWRRGRWVYARGWQPAMVACGLAFRHENAEYLPTLRAISSSKLTDVLTVQMLPGQTVADYTNRAEALAQSFGLRDCRVGSVPDRPQLIELAFRITDPLVEDVAVFEPTEFPDLAAVPVALCEDGTIRGMPLLGSHVLIGGATGSGKGSVIWSMIAGLTTAVRDRTVSLWVIDPKGGIELAAGAPMFDRFAYGDAPTPDNSGSSGRSSISVQSWQDYLANLLDDAVAEMQRRLASMRGISRLHAPTSQEPMIVIVIDELLSLTTLVTDRTLKNRINAALVLLLSQGRAAAVSVVAATQDARKELVSMRDLFPTRIALRTTEASQADLILGDGAHDRGARTEAIPVSMPGVGYVQLDGIPEPVRVRFSNVTDDDIDQLIVPAALDHRAPAPPIGADGYPCANCQWHPSDDVPRPAAA